MMTRYRRNHFSFGSAWIEPIHNLAVDSPGLPPFGVSLFANAKSDAKRIATVNIGVIQEFSAQGLSAVVNLDGSQEREGEWY
jgi:hypothetical protein